MRKITIAVIFCFFVSSLLLGGNVEALIFIDLPADITGVNVTQTEQDDENDFDQPFSWTDENVFVIQIDNELRRYIGVYIDRIVQGQEVTEVDNGDNDDIISPAHPLFTIDTLKDFFWGDTIKSSRKYILPVPEELGPGDEARYRVKVLGPAIGGTIPFDLSGPTAPPESTQLIVATASTGIESLVMPLLKLILPQYIPTSEDVPKLVADFAGWLADNEFSLFLKYQQSDYSGIVTDFIKWMAESEAIADIIKNEGEEVSGDETIDSLDQLNGLLKEPLQAAELFNLLIHLAGADWLTQVDVNFVYPKIESLDPAEGQAGDLITIRGKGFDPYDTENNTVYFTEIDELNGFPLTTLEADVVEVPAEDTIVVQVPEGFYPGPVRVVVDGFESNDDVLFDEPMTSLLIINSPTEGETVSGVITIDVTLTDPPDPFPESQATLFIDDNQIEEKQVDSASFIFSLDTAAFTEDTHTLKVQLTVNGHALEKSIEIIVAHSWYPPGHNLYTGTWRASTQSSFWGATKWGQILYYTNGIIYIRAIPSRPDVILTIRASVSYHPSCGTCVWGKSSTSSGPGQPAELEFDLYEAHEECPYELCLEYYGEDPIPSVRFSAYIQPQGAIYNDGCHEVQMALPFELESGSLGYASPCAW